VVTSAGVRFADSFPEATSVAVAGSFNEWSITSDPLTRDSTGIWWAVIRLPPGDHAFMYVVDGTRWVSPALAEEYVDDGFGARNGVVVVRPAR
jgi:1,4-alpha-glucan branching enzyme